MSDELVAAILAAGVRDERVLRAFRAVPRAAYVPPDLAGWADDDRPLPIPHDQVTTQPSLVAQMVAALGLTGNERVLEIGTGFGFQTALLAELSRVVWSVERWPDLAGIARSNLERQGVRNVEVVAGDGTLGLPEQAPFDAILVAAAFPTVPPPLVTQLAEGGRLVQPIGPGGADTVMLFAKQGDMLEERGAITGAYFVRLYGTHGFPD